MRVTKLRYIAGYTKDGTLQPGQGRVVIYEDKILTSHGNSPDHLALLAGLAAKYHLNKDDVVSNAIRMYYAIEKDTVILSASRKIDEEMFSKRDREYAQQILIRLHG